MATVGGLTWDEQGKHFYYTGIDAVALYVWNNSTHWYKKPVAWEGVTAVNESPSGAESNKLYADNIEYLNLLSKEEFGCTIECYQTPEEFDECDGIAKSNNGFVKVHGQNRTMFGLAYRVKKGSDTVEAGGKFDGNNAGSGYIYHIVYGCKAAPASRDFATVNDSPEAMTLSYEVTTTPLTNLTNFAVDRVAHIEIDCSLLQDDDVAATGARTAAQKQAALEAALYSASNPMPTPAEVATAIATASASEG